MTWQNEGLSLALGQPPELVAFGVHVWEAGRTCRWRTHDIWSVHLYRYRADLLVDGRLFPVRPGHASIVPPLAEQEWRFHTTAPQVYAHFRLPGKGAQASVAVMQDLGRNFERLYRGMEEAVGWFSSNRLRAEVRVWDVLWELSARSSATDLTARRLHPALERAVAAIERRLNGELRVEALAEEAGVSQNHLTRLFQARFEMPVVAYIRKLRTERARHLLLHTTQPIKAIAAHVGIPDLHLFNKVIRRELGAAPREVRGK